MSQKGESTTIIIKNKFKYTRIHLKSEINIENIETTIIKLDLNNNKKLFIISAYTKGITTKAFKNDLKLIFEELKLDNVNNYYIFGGDLNARHIDWGDSISSYRGNSLKNWLQNNDLQYRAVLTGTNEATYPANNSFIDLVIHDIRVNILNKKNGKIGKIVKGQKIKDFLLSSIHRMEKRPHLYYSIEIDLYKYLLKKLNKKCKDFLKPLLMIIGQKTLVISKFMTIINYFLKLILSLDRISQQKYQN